MRFHDFFPPPLTQKFGENFFQKKLSMGDFLHRFMGWGRGDGGKFKSYSVVCWWRRGELVWPGDKPAEEVHLERLWVGVNFTWYLTVVVIFMGLGGSKSLVGSGGFKVIIWGRASYKGERTIFFGGVGWGERWWWGMTPLDTIGLCNYY